MGPVKLFPTPEFKVQQPRDPVIPRLPANGVLVGPSRTGKTVLLVSMTLEQYRGCFSRIYIMSPSVDIDSAWDPVKDYIREELGVDTDREQAWWTEWDEDALRRIMDQRKRITQQSKRLGMKKLYQVLLGLLVAAAVGGAALGGLGVDAIREGVAAVPLAAHAA